MNFGSGVNIEDDAKKERGINETKAAVMLNWLPVGKEGMDIFNAFEIEIKRLNYDKVVQILQEYFVRKEDQTRL